MIKLGIVMPCYNNSHLTKTTIDSIVKNTTTDYCIFLIDDCSTDNTAEYIDSLKTKNIIYTKNKENIGVNKSWNIGIKKAIGAGVDYICVVNNDILVTEGWDKYMIDTLEKDNLTVVSPYSTEHLIPPDFPKGKNRHKNPNPLGILGCCFMFRPSFIATVGYIPEVMLHYYGDNWICDIANKYNMLVGYAPESYIHHLYTQTTKKLPSAILSSDGAAYRKYTKENNITMLVG
jgi:GT2 family glycosyltransferase